MYRAPALGLGPRATPPAPGLCVPTLGYQVFGQQSKLVSESINHWHYPSGTEVACGGPGADHPYTQLPLWPEDLPQNTGHGLRRVGKTNAGKLRRLSLEGGSALTAQPSRWQGGGLGPAFGRPRSSHQQGPASLLLCQAGRRRGGELGVRASGRPASRAQGRQRVQREEGQGVEDGVREGVRGVGASQRRLSPPLASWAGCRGRQGSSGKGS